MVIQAPLKLYYIDYTTLSIAAEAFLDYRHVLVPEKHLNAQRTKQHLQFICMHFILCKAVLASPTDEH